VIVEAKTKSCVPYYSLRNDFGHRVPAGSQHHQAVEAEGHAGAGREARVHRGQEPIRYGERRVAFADSPLRFDLDPSAQLGRVGQFVIAVAELDSRNVELEPLGDLSQSRRRWPCFTADGRCTTCSRARSGSASSTARCRAFPAGRSASNCASWKLMGSFDAKSTRRRSP
jgi:hypothetical protein